MERTYALIDLDNLRYNYEKIKSLSGGKTVICTVKANAYGHGDIKVASYLQQQGADFFAVSCPEEALRLRKSGITGDIIILGYSPVSFADLLIKNSITQTVYSTEYADMLKDALKGRKKPLKVHIAVDSGMGRIGFRDADEAFSAVNSDGFSVEGIFTHFSSADMFDSESKTYTAKQEKFFKNMVDALTEKGINFKFIHCQNSAATITGTNDFTNAVRAGIILYGLKPSDEDFGVEFKPLMSLKSVVSMVKTIHDGDCVSYGRKFTSKGETKVATVTIGYADGYRRECSGTADVLIRGVRCPVIGRVCMDQIMVDVSSLKDVAAGDEVSLIGAGISADEIAKICGTINYEIVCGVGVRVPRCYAENGEITEISGGVYPINQN